MVEAEPAAAASCSVIKLMHFLLTCVHEEEALNKEWRAHFMCSFPSLSPFHRLLLCSHHVWTLCKLVKLVSTECFTDTSAQRGRGLLAFLQRLWALTISLLQPAAIRGWRSSAASYLINMTSAHEALHANASLISHSQGDACPATRPYAD